MSARKSASLTGLKLTAVALTAMVFTASSSPSAWADSLLAINGHIYTGNPKQPFVEAIAVKDGRIVAVGTTAEIQKQKQSDSRILELGGRTVVPGFIDSHVHSLFGSMALYGLNLHTLERTISPIAQPEQFVAAWRAYAAEHPKDKVLFGRLAFNPQQPPPRALLDRAVSDRPVIIHNTSEHSLWVNTKALELAKIGNKPVPNAEEERGIFRNPDGSPTGVIREISMEIVERAVLPQLTQDEKLSLLKAGTQYLNSFGITTVVNATGDLAEIELYGALRDRKELTVRTRTAFGAVAYPHQLTPQFLKDLDTARTKYNDDWVSANVVKFFADGASGPWPPVYTLDKFKELIIDLDKRGYQIMTHALQPDSAKMVLAGFEALEKANGKRDRRLRLEHGGRIENVDLPKVTQLGVSVSTQPAFCCTPNEENGLVNNPWATLSKQGANVLFSSDWPCSWPPSPVMGIQQAIMRENFSRGDPLNPGPRARTGGSSVPSESLDVTAAVNAYTKNGAYAAFMDQKLGTLEVGKYADFAVLSQDIFVVPASVIGQTLVDETVVNGKTVYTRQD